MPPELINQPNVCAGIKESLRGQWLGGVSGGSPREIRLANHARRSLVPTISRGKDSTRVAALVFEAVLASITSRKQARFVSADLPASRLPALAGHADVTDAYFVELALAHGRKLATLDDTSAGKHGRLAEWKIRIDQPP